MSETAMQKKPCVFIQTNQKQLVGALVAAHSLKRNSKRPDDFDVKIMHQEDHEFFRAKEGKPYLRDGLKRVWHNDDLQSFTPLRFMPPELMGYEGRAVVIDPDVFAQGDVWELISRDMRGKAIMCRRRGARKLHATSVMLLDCAKLKHWHVPTQFNELFEFKRDYIEWTSLITEPQETIGLLENEWNDFDRLTPATKMVHNTKRKTQPWKTGLKVDFNPVDRVYFFPPWAWIMIARRKLFGDYGLMGRYNPHPDPKQEAFFYGLLRECLDAGTVTEAQLRDEMRHNHIRHDSLDLLRRVPPLDTRPLAA
jgi:heat shock protein HspQ